MKVDCAEPCGSCPYRKDVPVRLWHRLEFEKLLAADADELRGAVYGCHEGRGKPAGEQRACAGWLIDQRQRGLPSIQLRLRLLRDEQARATLEAARSPVPLYPSIRAMCRANGIRVRSPEPRACVDGEFLVGVCTRCRRPAAEHRT